MNPEDITLSKISQLQKDELCRFYSYDSIQIQRPHNKMVTSVG